MVRISIRNICIIGLLLLVTETSGAAVGFTETITGTISPVGDQDDYTFEALKDDTIFVRMYTAWNNGPENQLIDPDGLSMGFDYDTDHLNVMNRTLTKTGTYHLQVRDHNNDDTGKYSLYLQRTNNPSSAELISFGETKTGTIAQSVHMNTYTFSANAGDWVFMRMWTGWSGGPVIRLFDPNGQEIGHYYNNEGHSLQANQSLPSSGTYVLTAGDVNGGSTGTYWLYLQRTNNPGHAVTIGYGEVMGETISKPAQMNNYTFSGIAGMTVTGSMKSSWELGPEIRLYGPDGELLNTVYDTKTITQLTKVLPSDGSYLILVGDAWGGDTGRYSFCLVRSPFALPGYSRIPTDPDADCIFEDLNGNGRQDFSDVVLYFTQMQWIAANEPIAAFDLNGNGRIDFADIVALFNEV